jgi:hypothetical protein
MDLGERKIPSSASEPLSDARTPLADFFSILLGHFLQAACVSILEFRGDLSRFPESDAELMVAL